MTIARSLVTLIITTHYMDEAEQLCDRLVVMDGGLIIAQGSPPELVARYSTREVLELRFMPGTQQGWREKLDDLADCIEDCPTGCCCTRQTARRCWPRRMTGGLPSVSGLVRRSTLETCYSASPADRWGTDGG